MSTSTKPVSGTRDFGPVEVIRRKFIFDTLREVFERFGYQPIETPALERSEVLAGQYGEEGEKLIYKVGNAVELLDGFQAATTATAAEAPTLAAKATKRALRYDLTVPFARFVVQHRNNLSLPFKRYQMQPVWRADRPQKGRYREFWQCDVDVVGTDSLLCEAEFLQMYDQGLSALGLKDFTIRINHRKLLQAVAEVMGVPERYNEVCVAIDKLDKIGREGIESELMERGFEATAIQSLVPLFELESDMGASLLRLKNWLGNTESGNGAFADLDRLLEIHRHLPLESAQLVLDPTMARGLHYYTGTIFEVSAGGVNIGSIGGGGRYDDLAGTFGWKGLTGVGVSFGADRIYDVMDQLDLFKALPATTTQVLLVNFGGGPETHALSVLHQLRQAGVRAELYPDNTTKLGKQFGYADAMGIPFALVIGEEEAKSGKYGLKNLATGEQTSVVLDELLAQFTAQK